ncbi:MAG: hypothetical protein ACLGGV_07255 [Bacteroidia bacterium]
MNTTEIVTILIAVIAGIISFWQAYIAKQQLNQSKITKSEVENLLKNINERVIKIENISDETRKDVREQISSLINKQDENFKQVLNAPNERIQTEMVMKMIPDLLSNPELLEKILKNNKE